MTKRFVWLCLLFIIVGPSQGTAAESSEIPNDAIELARRGDWRVLGHQYMGLVMDSIYITHSGSIRYVYNMGRIDKPEWCNWCWLSVELAYGYLTPRRSPQPSAFSDITGDGYGNLVLIERVCGMNHSHPYLITVLSLDVENVTEVGHIQSAGEVLYFHDWNKDGRLEFVGTDSEHDFKYDESGLPLHPLVWRLGEGGYLPTGTEE